MCLTKHWRELVDIETRIFLNSKVQQLLGFGT